MSQKRLPLYAERALGELQATRAMAATDFERRFRQEAAVSCKAGCDHCCHYPLLVTVAEGILLYRHLGQKGRLTAALKKRIAEHADLTAFIDPAVWMRSRIPCPLLDEKSCCAGYEGRPLACRMTFSAGNPADCDGQAFNPEAMSNRAILRVVGVFEEKLLRKHGVSSYRMPLSRALLLAERIISQEVPLDEVERVLYREYLAT